jgi:AraC-like DNA-binding protein
VRQLCDALVRLGQSFAREEACTALADLPPAQDPVIRRAGDHLLKSWGGVPISQLAADAGLSPRQFRDRFGRETGLSPKAFAQVRRQRAAWIALVTGQAQSLGDASHAAGYADQAHFSRSARQAFGRPPGQVRTYVRTITHRFDWLSRP